MPFYRRILRPGGTYFFTLVTEGRVPIFADEAARHMLHDAIESCRATRPFTLDAIVLLPDHLHLLMTVPDGDADYSTRLASVKAQFTRAFLASGGGEQPQSEARVKKRRRGIWQRWFWEHTIRDEDDLNRHLNYIHYNPVKHGLARCPHEWPFSSFPRHVRQDNYSQDWQCICEGRRPDEIDFSELPTEMME